jgi:hypothetical protein
MKGLCLEVGQSRGWCLAGPSGSTALGTPSNDAAKNLSYLKNCNCFVCFLNICNTLIIPHILEPSKALQVLFVLICEQIDAQGLSAS